MFHFLTFTCLRAQSKKGKDKVQSHKAIDRNIEKSKIEKEKSQAAPGFEPTDFFDVICDNFYRLITSKKSVGSNPGAAWDFVSFSILLFNT